MGASTSVSEQQLRRLPSVGVAPQLMMPRAKAEQRLSGQPLQCGRYLERKFSRVHSAEAGRLSGRDRDPVTPTKPPVSAPKMAVWLILKNSSMNLSLVTPAAKRESSLGHHSATAEGDQSDDPEFLLARVV